MGVQMSGRVISGYREDGTRIVGYRKTSRRNPRRSLTERLVNDNDKASKPKSGSDTDVLIEDSGKSVPSVDE